MQWNGCFHLNGDKAKITSQCQINSIYLYDFFHTKPGEIFAINLPIVVECFFPHTLIPSCADNDKEFSSGHMQFLK